MTSNPELVDALRPVVDVFRNLGVQHYVGGSVASSVHGVARTTLDVDLIAELTESQVPEFVRFLADDYYVSESMIRTAIKNRSSFNLIHLATSFKVDVFVAKDRPFDEAVMERASTQAIGDVAAVDTWVASAEDVVLSKLEWYRLGDEVSERQWSDVLSVLKVQRERLDVSYMRDWAQQLGVHDLLERALAASY